MNLRKQLRWLLFASVLFFALPLQADDNKVEAWTKQVLFNTLSVNYLESDKDINQMRVHYTHNGWNAISSFLGNYLTVVRAKKLYLHPEANQPTTILLSGQLNNNPLFPRMRVWRVKQGFYIPELNESINFSVVVIQPNLKQPRLLIQSMSIGKYSGR